MSKKQMNAKRVKNIRNSVFKLSQPEFAFLMGCAVATVSRWEAGKAKPKGTDLVILTACQMGIDNYGEQRIRGVDWAALLTQEDGLLKVMAGIFNFATTTPAGAPVAQPTPAYEPPEQPEEYIEDPDGNQ